jgi:gliding motility-associated-like protein
MAGCYSGSGISGNKTMASKGGDDFWLVKLDAAGGITWQKALGGDGNDQLKYGYQTSDNGYLLAGHSTSGISGDKTTASLGGSDWWVVKINETGSIIWQWSIGGSGNDLLSVMHPTGDGGYILGGYSDSGISGDKSEKNRGGRDFWIVKLGPPPPVPGHTECQGSLNKAWVMPVEGDNNAYTYTWYNEAGTVLQTNMGTAGDTLFNLAAGNYSLSIKNAFGVDLTLPVVIDPENYNASFTTGLLCKGDSFTVTNSSGDHFTSYQWDLGDGTTSSVNSPSHVYLQEKDYLIRLIATTMHGCYDTAAVTITVNDVPSVSFAGGKDSFCTGAPVMLNALYSMPVVHYYWGFSDSTTSGSNNPEKAFSVPGHYTITHSVASAQGCVSDTVVKPIWVFAYPVLTAGPDQVTIAGEPVMLQGDIDDHSIPVVWTPARYLSNAGILKPFAAPSATQWYYLSARDKSGCSSSDSVQVTVLLKVQIPNAFSPNNDGINDRWEIPGLSNYTNASVQVFNRWGQAVYQSVGYDIPWNGKLRGRDLPFGTYYYIVDLRNGGTKKPLQGSVTILR